MIIETIVLAIALSSVLFTIIYSTCEIMQEKK